MIHGTKICGIDFPEIGKATYRVAALITNFDNQVLAGKPKLDDEVLYKNILTLPGGVIFAGQTALNALDHWCGQYLDRYLPWSVNPVAQLLFHSYGGGKAERMVLLVFHLQGLHYQCVRPNDTAYEDVDYWSKEQLLSHRDASGDLRFWLDPVLKGKRVVASLSVTEDPRQAALVCGVHYVDRLKLQPISTPA